METLLEPEEIYIIKIRMITVYMLTLQEHDTTIEMLQCASNNNLLLLNMSKFPVLYYCIITACYNFS